MKKADRRQLEGLYDRYEQLIYRVAYGVLKSVEQAEDVTQETFIQLYHNLPTLKKLNESETKRYILRIAKNKPLIIIEKIKNSMIFYLSISILKGLLRIMWRLKLMS